MSPWHLKEAAKVILSTQTKGGGGVRVPQGLPYWPTAGRWSVGAGGVKGQTGPLPWALSSLSLLPPKACRDFLELAEIHSRKWQRALQYEQEQRIHLEETIEQLAKQHNSLERAFRSAPGRATNPTKSFSEGERVRATQPG